MVSAGLGGARGVLVGTLRGGPVSSWSFRSTGRGLIVLLHEPLGMCHRLRRQNDRLRDNDLPKKMSGRGRETS